MKRFAPLALIVLALAAVPAALADDASPAAPKGHPVARMQMEILQLRLQLVDLRYRIVCHKHDSDRCTQFTQKVVDRLTKLDASVQSKLGTLQCTTDSTGEKCTVLTKLDQRLQAILQKLQSPVSTSDQPGPDAAPAPVTP
jgi:hypothetical protein